MKFQMFGCRSRGARTGKHLVPVGGAVLSLVEAGSSGGPVPLHSSWKFLALTVCCSSCVTVSEGLTRGLCLVKHFQKMQDVENRETETCL